MGTALAPASVATSSTSPQRMTPRRRKAVPSAAAQPAVKSPIARA